MASKADLRPSISYEKVIASLTHRVILSRLWFSAISPVKGC